MQAGSDYTEWLRLAGLASEAEARKHGLPGRAFFQNRLNHKRKASTKA